MGYYTNYELSYKILSDEDKANEVLSTLKDKMIASGISVPAGLELKIKSLSVELEEALDRDGYCDYGPLRQFYEGADSCKWYEHEKDMRHFSSEFPTVLFTLEGKGEETGDVWIKYFLNGKMQHCPAKITFDEFDEAELT